MSSFLETRGGRLAIIQCTVESDPEANLTLRRGDEVVACTGGCPPALSPRVHATPSYNSLRVEIREAVVEDEGTYVCRAGNAQGSASAAVDFRAESECGAGRQRWGGHHPSHGKVPGEGRVGRECGRGA